MTNKEIHTQKNYRILKIILSIVIAISLLWTTVFLSLVIISSNINSYTATYDSKNTIETLNTDSESLKNFAQNIIDYLYNGKEDLQQIGYVYGEEQELYTKNELLHMEDVKKIIEGFFYSSIIMLALLLACSVTMFVLGDKMQNKLGCLVHCLLGVLGALLILVIIIALNFNSAFIVFHKIFFPQGNWSFPSHCVLVNLIEEQMLCEFAFQICFLSIYIIGSILLICKFIKKESLKNNG